MTEDEALARAGDLPGAREVAGARFAPLLRLTAADRPRSGPGRCGRPAGHGAGSGWSPRPSRCSSRAPGAGASLTRLRQRDGLRARVRRRAAARGARRPRRVARAGRRQRRAPAGAGGRPARLTTLLAWPPPPSRSADICLTARAAARTLAATDSATRERALHAIADALDARTDEILEANARDMEAGREAGLDDALLDRLLLDARAGRRRSPTARAQVAALPDPVGEVIDGGRLANGLDAAQGPRAARRRRRRLRGAPERHDRRRRAVPEVRQRDRAARLLVRRALQRRAGRRSPRERGRGRRPARGVASSLVAGGGREELAELATQEGVVDLIIPRGGEGLKAALKGVATVPGHLRRVGQLPRLRRRERRPRRRASRSPSTPRSSGPASATRPRRCSSTPTSPRSSCRACSRALRDAGRRAARRRARARARRRRSSAASLRRRDRRGLGHRVPRADARGRRRRLGRRGDRARQRARHRALGGDRHRRHGVRAGVRARRRRRLRLRQRLDALHRRRRVRDGRRDRQLDAEAARPRADRPARAVHLQVRGHRRRPRAV